MRIKSNTLFSDVELEKIRGILRESKCPNESLSATFPGIVHHIDEAAGIIYFGSPPWDLTQEIEV